jgi:adenine-specific DNA-methyltransferase
LKDDGVIFISIDDNEEDNLKKVCSEIFGEENLIANIIWRKKYGIQNDAKYFSTSHEYLLCLTKNSSSFTPNLLDRTDEQNNRYKNPDNDTRGPWKSGDLSVGRTTEKDIYEIITPSGRRVLPPEGSSWRISKEKFQEYIKDYRIWFGETGNNVPSIKRFLSEVKQGITPTTFWDYDEVGHTDGSNKYLKSLFEGKQYFDYPKPVEYISKAIKIGTGENDIVLDFFAGSGTTAEAVLQLNSEDAGNRKFICVQLPEPTDEKSEAYKAGYMTISEITKERIRRAGDKIKSEMKEDLFSQQGKTLDIGFRAFKLASSNIRAWDGNPDALEDNLFNAESNIKENRTEEDVLYEILLKYGLDLTMPIEKKLIAGKQVFNIGLGALFICLGDNITTAVAEGIGKWKEELQPATTKVIFKDIGFTDVEKTNSMQILKRYGILEVNTI